MNTAKLTSLYGNAHRNLTAEAVQMLVQDTATVVGPILARMVEGADVSAKFKKGSETKDAEVRLVARAAESVGAHPLLQHLSFVQQVERVFAAHGHSLESSLPLTAGVRIRERQVAPMVLAAPVAKVAAVAKAAPVAKAAKVAKVAK